MVIYNFMFPRHPEDDRPGPANGSTARLKREDGPCPSCVGFLDQVDGAAEHVGSAWPKYAALKVYWGNPTQEGYEKIASGITKEESRKEFSKRGTPRAGRADPARPVGTALVADD